MNIPASIYAGDTVKWSEAPIDGKPSSVWTMTYSIKHDSGNDATSINGVPNASGGWDFTITAAASASLHVATHWWQAFITYSGERYTQGQGSLAVLANIPGEGANYDGRTQIEKDIAAVETEIRARATGGATIEYSIGNRSLKKESISALLSLRSQLRIDLAREKQAKRLSEGVGRSIGIRFGR